MKTRKEIISETADEILRCDNNRDAIESILMSAAVEIANRTSDMVIEKMADEIRDFFL